jgi:phosphoenolpyruvate carboxykinase (ATP)
LSERTPAHRLDAQGIETGASIHWNLTTAPLVEQAIARGEGKLAKDGPLVVKTGGKTGRSANDRFVVRNSVSNDAVWWGKSNRPMEAEAFDRLHADFLAALAAKETLYAADLYGGSQPEHRVKVRVINELAWHNLFIARCWCARKAASLRTSCRNIRSSICQASRPTPSATAAAARRSLQSISRKS